MAPDAPAACHLSTLALPPLVLECYAQPMDGSRGKAEALLPWIQQAWPHWLRAAREANVLATLGLADIPQWEAELTFTDDAGIRALNHAHRQKDEATDVLSFTLLADSAADSPLRKLPVASLGSIIISLEWAERHAPGDAFARYVVARFAHGMLHLAGMHHDTMAAYHAVVNIQEQVLDAVFPSIQDA